MNDRTPKQAPWLIGRFERHRDRYPMPRTGHPQRKGARCALFSILSSLFLASSCSIYTVVMPNALQPPGTYSAGKGEIGARTFLLLPEGGDFKIGLSDRVQLSGIATAYGSRSQVYGGGLLLNAGDTRNTRSSTYLAVFALGGGVNVGSRVNTGSFGIGGTTNNYFIFGPTSFVYEGWYPGFKLGEHFGINIPVRIFELFGNYQYTTISSGTTNTTTTTVPLWIATYAFVPELDLDFEWTHIGLDLGISLPLQFHESKSPVLLLVEPDVSGGLYYKW
ncbi:MAG: hypothetical protein M1491_05380 [Deltaproteobacteria bacterium]|nr:hypothetical protein [Deltaproteobacteria bacterium]MCL5278119.1 hypothetical protein [Deltaproteobacteria bacterium]